MTGPRKIGKCLITGASGFVGSVIARSWAELGIEVIRPSRQDLDLFDRDEVGSFLSSAQPDSILHLAATPPQKMDASWQGALNELQMLSNLTSSIPDDCRLIYSGSMAEYGRSGTHAEMDLRIPNTAYGFAKMICSDHAMSLRLSGQDVSVARLFGVYGPGERNDRLLPAVVRALSNGKPIQLSDGKQVRDWIHVDDVCQILLDLMRAEVVPAVINIGTGNGIDVKTVCLAIANILDADPALLQFGELERRAVDEDELVADVTILQGHFGHTPRQRIGSGENFLAGFFSGAGRSEI